MGAFLLWIARQIGITGCAVLLLLGYYEGIPGLRDIPFVERIPVVREFVAGRVATASADAAARATKNLVGRVELTAAEARVKVLEVQLLIHKQMAEAERRQAERAREQAETARRDLEAKIAEDTADDGGAWTAGDDEWMRAR
ncbi:hypothetical protein LAC81_07745 [Ensifer adhaerens]|uniref:hypothetical protein n=1 Tax=Ensifer adhaerens TaxID=106592 RepID=UPI001CBDC210|nr:hypothetical protein [Ensifer adhaerens]MBZ7921673.1 hypothetical protein [Ensifer adhaerens]UAX94088.1 hypothetical protein LAC78_07740 [Ensifer adhaerens]UAY01722.1 hypothetical protein LAC80_07745 [Ensifer adhaerens]UAY09106.1 hypothetical protein LAC81_07745 [Ensifer adhaerens]